MSNIIESYPTIIEVDGTEWIIPYDRVYDITVYNGDLVNISSSNITLFNRFIEDTSNVYPRLVCNVGRVCYVQNTYNDYDYLNSVQSLERKIPTSNFILDYSNIWLLLLVFIVIVKWLFSKN